MQTKIKYPTRGEYLGVPLFAGQDAPTLAIVRKHIDQVAALSDVVDLFNFAAADMGKAPEARLFAAARIRADYEIATERRMARPVVDLEVLQAHVGYLDKLHLNSNGLWVTNKFAPPPPPGKPYFERKKVWTAEELESERGRP